MLHVCQPATHSVFHGRESHCLRLLSTHRASAGLGYCCMEWRTRGFPIIHPLSAAFQGGFRTPRWGQGGGWAVISSTSGRSTAADYALSFRTLSAQTGWADDPLKLLFRKGLSMELQSELACRDEGRSLDQFIDLAIQIDNLVRSRRQPVSLRLRSAWHLHLNLNPCN